MGIQVMPGGKTILLFESQGKMRRIGITDLCGHDLHRYFVVEQLAGML
jgi:hypothetical protein